MAVTQTNRRRWRSILIARDVKWLFKAIPGQWQGRLNAWLWRRMFLAEDGQLHVAGEHVLADLREFCAAAHQPMFSSDPLVMARRIGRREVFDRIIHYLNLDEDRVHKLMELDDGLE